MELGKLKRLDPRQQWPHEARDFTPWLAQNLGRLGEAIGLELELQQAEYSVGSYSLDILATDLGSGRKVAIENQLEPTDHSHLGQLLTYAAGVDAGIVVWIAREVREEHRDAIDWLNRNQGGPDFFAVTIELLQIDESRPAVRLRAGAAPHDWSARQASNTSVPVSEKAQRYRDFYQALLDELREVHHFTNARAAQPQNWYSFSAGTSGLSYGVAFGQGGVIRVELYIDVGDGDRNSRIFEALRAQKDQVAERLGELEWQALENKRACRIATYLEGTVDDGDDKLEEYRNWMVSRLLEFRDVFADRLTAALAAQG